MAFPGDPAPLYVTTLTPSSAQLEAEWATNWRPVVLADSGPYLFSEVSFPGGFVNPTTLKLYLRDRAGKWSLTPDGANTLTSLDPSDGAWAARHLVGGGCSGFVWASSQPGTAVTTRGGVTVEG